MSHPINPLDEVLDRVGRYFVGTSPIQLAAKQIAEDFGELGISYAIAEAICLGAHGVIRATEDVDVLVTAEDLERFKAAWIGRGYVNLRPGGKAVRDTHHGIKVDFLLAGDFPGDGAPKPVVFPDPRVAAVAHGDLQVLSLPKLVELKLASGMTAPHRLQDLADVLRLIEVRKLPREFVEELDPWVRPKFEELWQNAQHPADDY